jgi:predicted ribosome quality control (RQC) complex YloA/Tae2 family protein
MRMSSKGSYTKPKVYEGEVAYHNKSFRDITAQLVEHLDGPDQDDIKPEDEDKTESSGKERSAKQSDILRKLRRRLRTLKKSLVRNEEALGETEAIEQLENWATLLRTYSYLFDTRELQADVVLKKEITGLAEDIIIPLDGDLTVGENINEMFSKAKKMKKQAVMFATQVAESKNEVAELQAHIKTLESAAVDDQELDSIAARKLGIKPQDHARAQKRIKSEFRIFSASDGTPLYVGKDAHNNDLLTKGAKANDYWFHVVGIPGSHVVAPMKRKTDEPGEKLLREAAMLAIHYSKFRESRAGEVYVTQKQHLKKKKGMAPGMWSVEKAETLYVKYTGEELKELLSRDNELS